MDSWLERSQNVFLPVYKRLPLEIQYGEGIYLVDRSGTRYMDFFSGIGVNALGYGHPEIESAITAQLQRNLHLSNYFVQDVQIELAEKLVKLTGFDKVFLTNSGTEAIEGILKIIKKWGKAAGKDHIICFQNSFHGRTLGSLSITAQKKYQDQFLPLLPGVVQIPFNDPEALERSVNSHTAAVFLEFVQGEGGIIPAKREFVERIFALREKWGFLVVADEIQAGIGRTGKFLAYQHFQWQPDAVALAKALGGGLPLGAFLVGKKLASVLRTGEHGSTFGGNPLSCAAGNAVLDVVGNPTFLQEVVEKGKQFRQGLEDIARKFPEQVKSVRGLGLMLAMEMQVDTFPLVLEGIRRQRIILNSTAGKVLRFLPPLIISQEEIAEGLQRLNRLFEEIFA